MEGQARGHVVGHYWAMAINDLIRDRRTALNLTQAQLAERLCVSGEDPSGAPGRDAVKRWESGKVIPGPFWQVHLSQVLAVSLDVMREAASLSRVNRRSFLGLSAMIAVHGTVAKDLVASIAGGDADTLAKIQTTHQTDIVTAAFADKPSIARLRQWADGGEHAILRVNAVGILAKLPRSDYAGRIAEALSHDDEMRGLYLTAVTGRVCAVDWAVAESITTSPHAHVKDAPYLAARFAQEAVNPRDVGARWCSSHMLRELSPLLGAGAL